MEINYIHCDQKGLKVWQCNSSKADVLNYKETFGARQTIFVKNIVIDCLLGVM